MLLERLEKENFIQGNAIKLIESYLDKRKFCVKLDQHTSNPHSLHYGVPQGSILAPCFYSLYTKPCEEIVTKRGLKIHVYADDCSIYMPFKEEDQEQAKKNFNRMP